jgi:hypothetical protein
MPARRSKKRSSRHSKKKRRVVLRSVGRSKHKKRREVITFAEWVKLQKSQNDDIWWRYELVQKWLNKHMVLRGRWKIDKRGGHLFARWSREQSPDNTDREIIHDGIFKLPLGDLAHQQDSSSLSARLWKRFGNLTPKVLPNGKVEVTVVCDKWAVWKIFGLLTDK